jgi:methionyl-tRNA formyltransferase
MKTVFFGTPDFALSSLSACHRSTELLAVLTQPDRPRGRGHKLSPCPVKVQALDWGLPVFSPLSLRKPSEELAAFESLLRSCDPDLFVVTAYGNLLPQRVLDHPKFGSINVHASLLPRWRGAAPIQRALEAGDRETGVCLQKMVLALDAGEVLAEARTPILPDESALALTQRLASLGGELLDRFLQSPNWEGSAQDETLVTYASKIEKVEGHWDPSWSAELTHRRTCAFAVWPQIKARLSGPEPTELKILETSLFARANSQKPPPAGTLVLENGRVFLETGVRPGELLLEVVKIQAPGKGPVRAWDYFRNHPEPLKLEKL